MDYITQSYTVKAAHHAVNEDHVATADGRLLIVADGMGGEKDGDIASQIACDSIMEDLTAAALDGTSQDTIYRVLDEAVASTDDQLRAYVDKSPDSWGMGTTIVIAVRDGSRLHVAWVGDSRCYIYNRATGLRPLTKDHSYVQQLIDEGTITVEESFTHPDNNIITRFLGGGDGYCIPQFVSYDLQPGDIVIACSDGLAGYAHDQDIAKCVARCRDYSSLTLALTQMALDHGSDDDITVAVMRPADLKPEKRSWWSRLFRGARP
ncbi:MAG: protein phosphatase 2C domain-containing protein [Bacteroidales bacterium]|nr:protein phosphatase 2C domain-containing protein [Bacteroidales bacterium]MCD8393963.1 protein phosphatase 2C domain-containing protein [Bacteroidales bacterium]